MGPGSPNYSQAADWSLWLIDVRVAILPRLGPFSQLGENLAFQFALTRNRYVQPLRRMRFVSEKFEWMKTLAGLIRLFEASGTSDRPIREPYAHNGQLQLNASDLGHCAVYEKELQRVWPITEENRKEKIAEFAEKHGFRLAYYKRGHCAIFLDNSTGSRHQNSQPMSTYPETAPMQ